LLAALLIPSHNISSDLLEDLNFSILKVSSVSSTGWQGISPSPKVLEDIVHRYKSGEIKADVAKFRKLPYQLQTK